ncbi:MAG: uracil-DNA glycosylase, partial [Ilumatobacteraceae bacterium]
ALHHTSHGATRAVILGQDPYHGPGQAHGLCFSVRRGVARPPSVANIHRELHDDLGVPPPVHGNLERWAAAGVLLLNTTLTVRGGEAGSHRGRGWERFTDRIIEVLSARAEPLVFVLWGSSARAKRPMIDTGRHGLVESAHPSPLSAHRGFLGSRPFSKVNALLADRGADPIDWTLT